MSDLTTEQKATNYETIKHIRQVQAALNKIIVLLLERGRVHDKSKLEEPELSYFVEHTEKLKDLTYDSKEYKQNLDNIAPALNHHYANNRHHPQFFEAQLEWRPVKIDTFDYAGSYEVSNFGDIRSLSRTVSRGKTGSFKIEGQFISQEITPKGYCRVQLSIDGKSKAFLVHRLVASAFIENEENKPFINHKNGNKKDNRIDNLEWCTSSENAVHSYETGLKKSSIKYAVTCKTLDITTLGCDAMEKELRNRGYEKASASSIWRVINSGGTHLDLEFEGNKFEEWMRSPISQMNLVDIIELLCDWTASTKRTKDGNIRESLILNAERFHIEPQLLSILENSIDLIEDVE